MKNIFEYAQKEFTLDAMIAWILSTLEDNEPKIKNIGLQFIRKVMDDESLRCNEVIIADNSPFVQTYSMDVYAIIYIRGKMYPFIFEDKTDTYLHDGQFLKYCKKVKGWKKNKYLKKLNEGIGQKSSWGKIVYVFTKIGYMSKKQVNDFEQQSNEVKLELDDDVIITRLSARDIYDVLNNIKYDHYLISSYKEYIKKRIDDIDRDSDVNNCFGRNYLLCMDSEAGTSCIMNYIFGENFYYSYQKWASYEWIKVKDFTVYFRFDYSKGRRVFKLMMYRFEEDRKNTRLNNSKMKLYNALLKECKEYINGTNCTEIEVEFNHQIDENEKNFNEKAIIQIIISDSSLPLNVCNFIRKFMSDEFNKMQNAIINCIS